MEEINKNENLIDKNEKLNENEIEKMEVDYPKEVKEYGFINKDPYTSSDFISGLLYYWAYKIIKLSQYIKLKSEYLGKLEGDYTSKNYLSLIKEIWENKGYKFKKNMPLLKTGFRSNIKYIIIILFLSIIRSILSVTQVTIFREFMIKFSSNNTEIKEQTFFSKFSHINIGLIYLIIKFLEIFLQRKCFENQMFLGYKSGTEISCLIYEKLLNVSPSSMKKKATTGEITNFIQVDSNKLTFLMLLSPDVLTMPILIIAYSYMLFKFMGVAFLYGILSTICFSIFTAFFFKTINSFMKKLSSLRDTRMRIITETFNNIKILKLYSWEDEFKNRINEARDKEINTMRNVNKLFNIAKGIGYLSPVATSAVCIGAYQYINKKMKIEDIFTCLNILSSLQMPLTMIPIIFNLFLQTIVSMGRIEKFLNQDEINPSNVIRNSKELNDNDIAIKIENGFYSWGIEYEDVNNTEKENLKLQKKESKITFGKKKSFAKKLSQIINPSQPEEILKNLNFEIKKGEFIVIIGEVGSGKSSLLQAILNNMIPTKKDSKIYINGSISYVRQIPWIQNTTVRNNILFFQKADDSKYKKIIDITELKSDLEILSGGDLTEIGEKGVNLSGGQKARIALARALYSDKDIYFLDDPISALDANVGMKIMKNCIINYLNGKTRILVTHALQYVAFADRIFYMKDGEINWMGNYEEIKNEYFYKDFYEKSKNPFQKKNSELQRKEFLEEEDETDEEEIENKNNEIKRITQEEELKADEVKPEVYKKYIIYIGGFIIILLYILFLLTINGLRGGSDIWLGYWSEHQSENTNMKYFIIYCSFGILGGVFNYFNAILSSKASLRLSGIIHKEMIECLIKAPICTFHETIPKGQIFNRLSKDINEVDNNIMSSLTDLFSCLISFISSILVCSIYQPYCLIFLPILLISGYKLSNFYLNCSRQLTRMESAVRSPMLNLLNETIPGALTIRAYDFKNEYLNKYLERSDDNLKIKIIIYGTSQWFDLILDLMSFSFLFFLLCFTFLFKNNFSPKIIGLLLTYSINLQNNLIRGIRQISRLENSMISFERCLTYTKIQSEKPKIKKEDKILENWPQNGKIQFIDYSVKYRPDTEIVLSDLNFTIESGNKVGIVGRTGSGKSTITLCLFRILEALKGKILIDDIDISTIGLDKLRKSLTIIPQDPALIEGTLRYNIDPLNNYTDEEIINVIKKINFGYIIEKNKDGLKQEVSEGGTNLSVGEKQLICITRAILRKSKIIIMDEATANIDYKTEEIIQNVINEILTQSTIITIAHRIKTILNYDKIIVLENGEVVDFDSPKNLIEKKEGIFYKLYQKSNL